MNWSRIGWIIRKDLREVLSSRMVVLPMIILPFIFCLVLPAVIVLVMKFAGLEGMNGVDQLVKVLDFYPIPASITATEERILYIFLNYTFLPFFMLIPVMVSSIISANSIVGEKERKTLETLLYTPLSNREFLAGKLLSAFLPAILVTLTAFILYFAFVNILYVSLGGIFIVRALIWLPAILLTTPAVSLLSLGVTLLVSLKAKTFMEAQQTAGLVVLPFVLIVVGQITGFVLLNIGVLILASVVLLGVDYFVMMKIGPRFSREAIISTL